ncbi:MAG: tetratricopeptide repeat protein, partial [Gemmatimonadetes bacterium]|nr:tetratricopeptide repeat protein [Gemmatimonadota bacterium]
YWERATWHAWTTEPGRTARLFLRKLRFWFHATESQTNLSYYFAIDQAPVLRILRLHLGWILPLAIVGFLAGGWREPLLTLPIAVSIVTCLVFYMSSEYRHPVVPCLLLLAAAGGRVSLDVFRHAVIWRRVALGAGLVALLVLANFRDPFLARLQSRRVDYVNFGTLAAQAGDLEVAERLFRRSIAIDPDWDVSRAKLAEVLQRLGRPGEAIEELRAAEAGAGEPSPMMAASELFRAGRLEEARAAFVAIAEAGGEESAAALNNAGLCSMQLGDVKGAVQAFEASRSLDSQYASPVIHLGRLALAIGDSTAAARYADEAVELAPQDGRAQRLQARVRGEVSPGEVDEGMD